MSPPILSSTFLLTLLLVVGLFFFIRASVKDRTESVQWIAEQSEDSLLAQLQAYFEGRSYRVATLNAAQNQVTFEGVVRPSLFLAIFLTLLAAIGFLCLVLVLSMLAPQFTHIFLGLVLLSPLVGLFYWRKAERPEQVLLQVKPLDTVQPAKSLLIVTAHRDELAAIQQALSLKEYS